MMDDFWAAAGGRRVAQGTYEYQSVGAATGVYERWAVDQLQAKRRVVRAEVGHDVDGEAAPFYYVRLDYDMRGHPTSMEITLEQADGWHRANYVLRGDFARVLISRPDGSTTEGYLELTPGYMVMAHAVATGTEFYRQHDDRPGSTTPVVAYYVNIDRPDGLLLGVRLNNVQLANVGSDILEVIDERCTHLSLYQTHDDGSRAWSLDGWFDRRGNCLLSRSDTGGNVVDYRVVEYDHELAAA